MRSSILVTLLLAGLALPALSPNLTQATAPGSNHVVYVPGLPDANAYYFRVSVTPETKCIRWAWHIQSDPGEPMPYMTSEAYGPDENSAGGVTASEAVNGRYLERGTFIHILYDPSSETGHTMLNVSAAGQTVAYQYEQTGYNETDANGLIDGSSPGAMCDTTTDGTLDTISYWFSFVGTMKLHNGSVTFDFCDSVSHDATYTCTHGNASGAITFAAESNRTFLKQLKDFDGTFSYNGAPPLATGANPSAAGANLQKSIHVSDGMTGGFVSFDIFGSSVGALSYVGPGGVAGGSVDGINTPPATTAFTTFDGGPGDWTFNVHAYDSPSAYSTLFLWGADIATS